jgi:hypothetical protein
MTRILLGYGVLIGMVLGGLTSAEAMRCGQREEFCSVQYKIQRAAYGVSVEFRARVS